MKKQKIHFELINTEGTFIPIHLNVFAKKKLIKQMKYQVSLRFQGTNNKRKYKKLHK